MDVNGEVEKVLVRTEQWPFARALHVIEVYCTAEEAASVNEEAQRIGVKETLVIELDGRFLLSTTTFRSLREKLGART